MYQNLKTIAMEKTNRLIAEFMGFTYEKNIGWYDNDMLMSQNVYDNQDGNCFDELLFDKSWDWLMPVVIKIGGSSNILGAMRVLRRFSLVRNIDETYQAVVEFIKDQK